MNFFNNIKAKCEKASAKREVDLIDNKINQLREKKAELTGKAEVKKEVSASKTVHNVSLNSNHEDVKRYMLKHDNVDELVSYMAKNEYSTMLIDIAKDLSIDVVSLKYNVTQTTKNFLTRVKKHNVKELSESEADYFTNHLIVLYATKHKVKSQNIEYKFGNRKAETLQSYAKFRRACVKDIHV